MTQRANINLSQGDCMEAMTSMEDNQYDLAIVDPPYGIANDKKGLSRMNGAGKLADRAINKDLCEWDKYPPSSEYFEELFRVSKNQIIWGGNYFDLPPTRGVVCWDKCQPWPNFSAWEMAWTSFDLPAKMFKFDNRTSGKIHPTQKPIELYKWLLANYANEGDKILDTHGGSMSIALACWDLKYDLDLWELDKDYYQAGKKRFENYIMQGQFDY